MDQDLPGGVIPLGTLKSGCSNSSRHPRAEPNTFLEVAQGEHPHLPQDIAFKKKIVQYFSPSLAKAEGKGAQDGATYMNQSWQHVQVCI
jgi:hypothetical protein